MLPVIWTDDEAESECKTYFNLYTFIVFLAWCLHITILLLIVIISRVIPSEKTEKNCPPLKIGFF